MAALRRPREVLSHETNKQDENYKSNSIQLRSKGHFEELATAQVPMEVHGKPVATRLARQNRGVMVDIGNNRLPPHSSKDDACIEMAENKVNILKENIALSSKNEGIAHRSVIEEPKAKRKHFGENGFKKPAELTTVSESSKDIDDVNMTSPPHVAKTGTTYATPEDVGMAEQGHKSDLASPLWEDVDADDVEDPQMVSGYVNDIFAYLRILENKHPVYESYLRGKKGAILPQMRAVLTDWMVEVHQQFALLQETLYLSIAILDRYMQVSAEKVERKKLQLVGVTSMFIAAKYEEMYAPEIGDFVYITDNAYSESQIRDQEVEIIKHLDFNLERPLPLHFLRRFSKVAQVDTTVHNLAKYIMELTVVEYKFCHLPPSQVAASSLAISMMAYELDQNKTLQQAWNSTIEHYTFYSLESIAGVIQQMASHVIQKSRSSDSTKRQFMAVKKKYSDKKFLAISQNPVLGGINVLKLAKGQF